MGGLGPGIGGFELVIIGVVALLVVGPKDLPVLMRRVGQMVAKARSMANEFRSSFDEMARQSELDDLRKEVEALRSGQGSYALGAEADNAFKDIRDDLNRPAELAAPPPAPAPELSAMVPAASEWPDAVSEAPVQQDPPPTAAKPARKPRASVAAKAAAADPEAEPAAPKRVRRKKTLDL